MVVNKDQDLAQAGTSAGSVPPDYTNFNVTPDGRRFNAKRPTRSAEFNADDAKNNEEITRAASGIRLPAPIRQQRNSFIPQYLVR